VKTIRILALALRLALFLAARSAAQTSDADASGARKASDALMADLVDNRMADAMEKLAPKAKPGSDGFRKSETKMIEKCGRPLDSKIQDHGKPVLGEDVLPEGTKTNWSFRYRCKTTRQPSEYWVTAEAVEGGGYKLALTCNPDHQSLPVNPK
jgi:hypothetical protein